MGTKKPSILSGGGEKMNNSKLLNKRNFKDKINDIDPDVLRLLSILDELFSKLPEEVINEFGDSEYFQLYKRVMEKYNIGI